MKKVLVTLIALLVLCLAVSVASAVVVDEGAVVAYGDVSEITAIGGHQVNNAVIVREPTCTEKGLVRFDCAEPTEKGPHGETTTYHIVYIKELGHKWSSAKGGDNWGKVVVEPTCTESGLAVDICEVCGEENWDNTRTLLPIAHAYNGDYRTIVYNPTCAEYGWAIPYKVCSMCGKEHENETAREYWDEVVATGAWGDLLENWEDHDMIRLPMLDHKWTLWNVDPESTCGVYGAAWRACERCGAQQVLDDEHPFVWDNGDKIYRTDLSVLKLKNSGWQAAYAALNGQTFDKEAELYKALEKLDGVEYDVKKDWLEDCYTRTVVLSCPICKGTVHKDITYKTVYPLVCAHEFAMQPFLTKTVGEDDKVIKNADEFNMPSKMLYEKDPSFTDYKSVAPGCEKDGFALYLCVHDENSETKLEVTHTNDPKGEKDKTYYKEVLPAYGHDWGDWEIVDAFKNADGEDVVTRIRVCADCNKTENQVIKLSDIPAEPETKDGLVLEDDGNWYYYIDGEWQFGYTGFVTFQGGEFWVTDGVVDTSLNGMINCPGDKWLFFANGQVQKVTQMAEYAGEWFMIVNGELDKSANGLYDYDGGKFAFAAGRLLKETNGIWQNPKDHVWYFLAQGQLQKYTGTATYDGATFELVDGVVVVK